MTNEEIWRIGDRSRGPLSASAVARLEEATRDKSLDVRSSAFYILVHEDTNEQLLHSTVVKGLNDSFTGINLIVLNKICEIQSLLSSQIIAELIISALDNEDDNVVYSAVNAIGSLRLESFPHASVAPVISLSNSASSPHNESRQGRVRAILSLTRQGVDSVNELTNLTYDGDVIIRAAATIAIGHLGPNVFPIIQKGTEDASPIVRAQSALALRKMGAAATPVLRRLLYNADGATRWAAVDSLVALGKDGIAAVPDLIDLLRLGDESTGHKAAIALVLIARDHPETVRALVESLNSPNALVRAASINALSGILNKD